MDEDISKLRSCTTINTFFHESQQEVNILRKQICSRDGIIADLKARLARYERTYVLEGEEHCLVGPSKSLVESLCRDNCKLKQKLKETQVDMSKKLDSSKIEIQILQQKLKEREQELGWPEHEKEREIQRLREKLAVHNRAQATQDVLCNSLAEEAEQLRGQLGATVRVCEELLGRLEKQKNRAAFTEQRSQSSEMRDSSEVAHLNAIITKLQEENQQFKKRVVYVENLNSKWQKYDLSREDYVRGLCQKLKESSGLMQCPGATAGNTALLQLEISRLNGLLEEKMRECERLSRERDECKQRDHEHIQMLKQQVLAYIDDFKSERSDRERAQSKILNLQEEVGRLQLQIRAQNAREVPPQRRILSSFKKISRKQAEPAEPLLGNTPPDASARRTIAQFMASGSSELQCPRCFTMYDEKHTAEYMNHCEECAKL